MNGGPEGAKRMDEMKCPTDVQEALLQVLTISLLRIRSYGWSEQADKCAVEADHVHNIPAILRQFSVGALMHYWQASRSSFVEQNDGKGLEAFQEPWDTIERFIYSSEVGE